MGLLGRAREHSRCYHWSSQPSHRLVRVVPRDTIPAQTPALRGRVLRVGGIIHAVVASDGRVLAVGSALCRGHHDGPCEGRVGKEARFICGLSGRQGSCTCTWGSLGALAAGVVLGAVPAAGGGGAVGCPEGGLLGGAEGTVEAREVLFSAVRCTHVQTDDGAHGDVTLRVRLCGAQHGLNLHRD